MYGNIIGSLWIKALIALPALMVTASVLAGQEKAGLQQYLPRLEKNLKGNILPFWLNKSSGCSAKASPKEREQNTPAL